MFSHKDDFEHRQNPGRHGKVQGKRKKTTAPSTPLTAADKKRRAVKKMASAGDAFFRKHMR